MARITVITCDRCGASQDDEVLHSVMIVGRDIDLCGHCTELFISMKWEPQGDKKIEALYAEALRQHAQLERDKSYALARVAEAGSAWRNGDDERARTLLREATARLANE